MRLKIDQILSGCKIISKIAEGGMGEVYLAKDEKLKRKVAIKVMHAKMTGDSGERFIREAEVMARLNHNGIVQIYSFGEYDNSPYFVMEYVDGPSLSKFINKARFIKNKSPKEISEYLEMGMINHDPSLPYFAREPISNPLTDSEYLREVISLISNIADSLHEAHKLGIVHRDIKPDNILIDRSGRVKLSDFGIAKMNEQNQLTGTMQWVGTLQYMAPEQFEGSKGKITSATDIYALGMILYELLTLEHPVKETDPASIMREIFTGGFKSPSILNKNIPSTLDHLVLKCLEQKALNRNQNMEVLADELRLVKIGKSSINVSNSLSFFKGFTWLKLSKSKKEIKTPSQIIASQEKKQDDNIEKLYKILGLAYKKEVSNSDKELSAELLKEAQKEYLGGLEFKKAIDLTKEALELNPLNIDALIMLYEIQRGFGGEVSGDLYPKIFTKLYENVSPVDQNKIDIFRLAFIENDYPKAMLRLRKYLKEGGDDLLFFDLEPGAYFLQGDVKKAIEITRQQQSKYPDLCMIAYMTANFKESIGETNEAINLVKGLIEKFPSKPNLYLILITWYRNLGQFKEMEQLAYKMEKIDPANFFVPAVLANYHAHLGNYEKALSYLRNAITLHFSNVLQASYYYKMYRLYYLLNRSSEGDKCLQIARNLDPRQSFKTLEEIKSGYAGLTLKFVEEFKIDVDTSKIIENTIKDYLLNNLSELSLGDDSLKLDYFEISEMGSCRYFQILGIKNRGLEKETKHFIYLSHVPFGSILDQESKILKCEFKTLITIYGSILAHLNLNDPLESREWGFYCMELDGSKCMNNQDGILTFNTLDLKNVRMEQKYSIIKVPNNIEVLSCNFEPSKLIAIQDNQYYIYSKYLFQNDKFEVELKLNDLI